MTLPASPPLPLRESAWAPALHPELGALVLAVERPWPARVAGLLGLAAVAAAFVEPAVALGLLLGAAGIHAVAPAPLGVYERGLRKGKVQVPWSRVRSFRFQETRAEWVTDEGTFVAELDEEVGARLRDWTRAEVLPGLAQEWVRRARHGERVALAGEGGPAVVRGGLHHGGTRLGWADLEDPAVSADAVVARGEAGEIRVDAGEAGAWSLEAVARGRHVPYLLERLEEGGEDSEPLRDLGTEEVARLARAGWAPAQVELARRLLAATPPDVPRARLWFRVAAHAGDPRGALELGKLLRDHARGDWDLQQAAGWISTAVEEGLPEAKLHWAYMKEQGLGTPYREIESRDLYQELVDAGHHPSLQDARARAFRDHFEGWARALGADRPPEGASDPHPELGRLLFAQHDRERGEPFAAHERGLVTRAGVHPYDAYMVLVTREEPGESAAATYHEVELREGETTLTVGDFGHPGRFFRWGFERLVAPRIAAAFEEVCASGKTLYLGEDLQIAVDAAGVTEEVTRGTTTREDRVDWADFEGATALKGQVHVMARKAEGRHRSAVGLGIEEPNAWVLHALAQRVAARRAREGSEGEAGEATLGQT